MKTCLQVKNNFAVLYCYDSTSCKTSTISQSVDLVEDWCVGVARAQKVRMQRVHMTGLVIHCAGSRDQRLSCDLATKYSLSIFLWGHTTKNIDFNGLKVEQGNEIVKGARHSPIVGSSHDTSTT
jgi:hypothetical protein